MSVDVYRAKVTQPVFSKNIDAVLGISPSFCFRLRTQHSLSLAVLSQERINRTLALAHLILSSNYLTRSLHAVAQICLFLLNVSFPVTLLAEKAKATSSDKLFSVEESSTEPVPNTYRKTNTRITYANPKRRCIYRFLCVIRHSTAKPS